MNLFRLEFFNTTKNKRLAAVLILFCLANLAFLLTKQDFVPCVRGNENLLAEFDTIEACEAIPLLEEKLEEYQLRSLIQSATDSCFFQIASNDYREQYPELYEQIISTPNTYSEEEVRNKVLVFEELLKQAEYLAGYKESILQIKQDAQAMVTDSLFSHWSRFQTQVIAHTAKDFTVLAVGSTVGLSAGLTEVTDYMPGDCILLLLAFFICGVVFSQEEIRSQRTLFITAKNGRLPWLGTKFAVAATLVICVSGIFVGSTYTVGYIKYGFGDLHRLIQSYYEFKDCVIPMSAGKYLLVCFLRKTGLLLMLSTLFSLLLLLFNGSVFPSYGIGIGLLTGAAVLQQIIPANYWLNHLKYLNPFFYMNGFLSSSTYIHVNFFSFPINVWNIYPLYILFPFATCLFLCGWLTCRRQSSRQVLPGILQKHRKQIFTDSSSLALNEGHHLLIIHKLVLLFLVLALLETASVLSHNKVGLSLPDQVYRTYIRLLGNDTLEVAYGKIEDEKTIFDSLALQITALRREAENGIITEAEMTSQISILEYNYNMKQEGFSKLLDQRDYLQSLEEMEGLAISDLVTSEAWFLNEEAELSQGIAFMVFLLLLITIVFTADERSKTKDFYRTTKQGRTILMSLRLGYTILFAFIIYLAVYIPHYALLVKDYGLPSWSAAVTSIPGLPSFSGISQGTYFSLVHIIKFLGFSAGSFLLATISCKFKKPVSSLAVCSLITLLPAVLEKYGFSCRYIGFNELILLSGRLGSKQEQISALVYGVSLLTCGILGLVILLVIPTTASKHKRRKYVLFSTRGKTHGT